LTILFDRTLHNEYFTKLPFGSREKFAKMTNITLKLVVLTWLHQLQEYFYKIGDTNEIRDWNTHGKYAPVKARHVTREFPLDNMHMMKTNSTAVVKITSVQWIKADSKNTKKVVKSLKKWAAKILCQDNNYVQNLANADEEMKNCFQRTKKHSPNMLCQIHPTNQTMRRQVTTLILPSSHQNIKNDTKLQTNYICIFVVS
jgi:hypothetical protein